MNAYREPASHSQRHSSRAIKGTLCDGCRSMCVIERGRRVRIEEYWCDRLHGVVEPPEECKYRRGEMK